MKRTLLIILATIYAHLAYTQTTGIQWENLSLDEAIARIDQEDSEKDFVFLYLGTDIPLDPEMPDSFKEETTGKYFNENFLCIMADAATPDGNVLAKRLKASTYPYFALFVKTPPSSSGSAS